MMRFGWFCILALIFGIVFLILGRGTEQTASINFEVRYGVEVAAQEGGKDCPREYVQEIERIMATLSPSNRSETVVAKLGPCSQKEREEALSCLRRGVVTSRRPCQFKIEFAASSLSVAKNVRDSYLIFLQESLTLRNDSYTQAGIRQFQQRIDRVADAERKILETKGGVAAFSEEENRELSDLKGKRIALEHDLAMFQKHARRSWLELVHIKKEPED